MRFQRGVVRRQTSRRGLTTPLVAAALLIAMLGLALVLDRLWLESAWLELSTAAEASALAAARVLVDDDALRPDSSLDDRLARARRAAGLVASVNRVAGDPVALDLSQAGDVRFGVVAPTEDGPPQWLETSHAPTHVSVTAQRTRSRNNPVALFIGELTRQPYGDVVARAEAGLDNRVVGVRPFAGAPVPALPLAIWRRDPAGRRTDTWEAAVTQRRGADEYGYDPDAQRVTAGPDGIPELTLRSQSRGGAAQDANVQLLDLGNDFQQDVLDAQFATGLTAEHLAAWNGALHIGGGTALTLRSTPRLQSADCDQLQAIIGQPRICLLYAQARPTQSPSVLQTECTALAAVRVLAVQTDADGGCRLVVQPTIVTTRTALLDGGTSGATVTPNPYVYRLSLTN